jgi:hypothetical protein
MKPHESQLGLVVAGRVPLLRWGLILAMWYWKSKAGRIINGDEKE